MSNCLRNIVRVQRWFLCTRKVILKLLAPQHLLSPQGFVGLFHDVCGCGGSLLGWALLFLVVVLFFCFFVMVFAVYVKHFVIELLFITFLLLRNYVAFSAVFVYSMGFACFYSASDCPNVKSHVLLCPLLGLEDSDHSWESCVFQSPVFPEAASMMPTGGGGSQRGNHFGGPGSFYIFYFANSFDRMRVGASHLKAMREVGAAFVQQCVLEDAFNLCGN